MKLKVIFKISCWLRNKQILWHKLEIRMKKASWIKKWLGDIKQRINNKEQAKEQERKTKLVKVFPFTCQAPVKLYKKLIKRQQNGNYSTVAENSLKNFWKVFVQFLFQRKMSPNFILYINNLFAHVWLSSFLITIRRLRRFSIQRKCFSGALHLHFYPW